MAVRKIFFASRDVKLTS